MLRDGVGRGELARVVGAPLDEVAAVVVDVGADGAVAAVVCAAPDVHPAITEAARTATAADTNPERTGPP